MELLIVIVVALIPCIFAVDDSEIYADPMQLNVNENQQETASDNTLQSIQKSLKQHTETLEKVLAVVQRNEELTNKIIENLNVRVDEPEKHGKIKIYHSNRRSNNENEEIPIVKFGKDIGLPITFQEDKQNSESNKEALETNVTDSTNSYSGRRNAMYKESTQHSGTKNIYVGNSRDERRNNANSPWCDVAAKCTNYFVPVCGFDDKFGRSKFNSICHMLQVNCYWNYNFSIVMCRRSVD